MKKYLAVFLIYLLFFTFFLKGLIFTPGIFLVNAPDINDLPAFTYPAKFLYQRAVREGRLPLWEPRLLSGFPLFAEGQVGALYPPNLLFHFFLPLTDAVNLSYLFAFVLASFFMFLYLREVGLPALASFLGGLFYSFSGFFVGQVQHLNFLQAASLLPLLFLFVEKYLKTFHGMTNFSARARPCPPPAGFGGSSLLGNRIPPEADPSENSVIPEGSGGMTNRASCGMTNRASCGMTKFISLLGNRIPPEADPSENSVIPIEVGNKLPPKTADPSEKFVTPKSGGGAPHLEHLLFFSLALACQIFAGAPQIFLYSLVGVLTYFFLRWVSLRLVEGPAFISFGKGREFLKAVTLVAAAVFLSFLLSAVQLLPTLELKNHSQRSRPFKEGAEVEIALFPRHLFTLFSPFEFGANFDGSYYSRGENEGVYFHEVFIYGGVLPLLLLLFLPGGGRRKLGLASVFLFLAAFSFLASLGFGGPLGFLQRFPLLNSFRVPARFILLFSFSLSVLAALGFSGLLKRLTEINRRKGLPIVLTAVFLVIFLVDVGRIFKLVNPVASANVFLEAVKTAEGKLPRGSRILSVLDRYAHKKLFGDLSGITKGDAAYLKFYSSLPLSTGVLADLALAGGYAGLYPERIYNLVKAAEVAAIYIGPEGELALSPLGQRFLFATGAEYFVSPLGIEEDASFFLPGAEESFPFADSRAISYFKVLNPLSRVFIVPKAVVAGGEEAALESVLGSSLDLKRHVVLEENTDWGAGDLNFKITSFRDGKRELKVAAESDNDGFLVLLDTFYPGWRAFVDGRETKIYQANYAYRAVKFPKGSHIVEFKYDPRAFWLGAVISLLTAGVLGWVVALKARLRRKSLSFQ